jgi:uncharacterized protein (TIGR03435 family)
VPRVDTINLPVHTTSFGMSHVGHKRTSVSANLLPAVAAIWALAMPASTHAQPRETREPSFDVATVTPATGEPGRSGMNFEPGGGFKATNVALRPLVEMAYRRHAFDSRRVTGGPPWIDTERFDVTAKAPTEHVLDPDGYPRRTGLMLQNLLADRFKLRVRVDSTDQPAYILRVVRADGQLGPALTRSAVDCGAFMAKMLAGERPAGGPQCGFGPYPRRLVGRAVTIADLAGYLSMLLKRPVVDKTGLTGGFDLEVEGVEVTQPGPPGPSTRPSNTTRSIVEMLPEQLGLRLEEATAPVETLVIEHAERPAAR